METGLTQLVKYRGYDGYPICVLDKKLTTHCGGKYGR